MSSTALTWAFLQRRHAATNAHDADATAALCADDVAAGVRIGGPMTGPLTPPGFAPTGGRLSFETAELSQFESGLLAHHTVILNILDLARQIGVVPQPGTVADRIGVWMRHVAAFLVARPTRPRR